MITTQQQRAELLEWHQKVRAGTGNTIAAREIFEGLAAERVGGLLADLDEALAVVASQDKTITEMERAANEHSATVKRLVEERDALRKALGEIGYRVYTTSAEINAKITRVAFCDPGRNDDHNS